MEDGKGYSLLIVEDGKVNQRVLVDALQDTYTLYTAVSGHAALKMASKVRPHIILLDIILPDIDGFEVLKQLKEDEKTRNIPVIFITALDNDQDEEKGLTMGAVDYIRKPFNSFLVKARVDIHIQLLRQLRTIEKLSFFDPLTDLLNRRKFDYHMEYEWRRAIRKKTLIGLLMMDLDYFKSYNDHYGHMQGDLMLKAVAAVLKNTLHRPTDITCRWGGEEFAVLISETTPDGLLLIAEKIRAGIETLDVPYILTGESTKITMSIGANCVVPCQNELVAGFIEGADSLLYKAKKAGRNRVVSSLP